MNEPNLNQVFSSSVRRYRKARHLSAEVCAKKLGIGKTTLLNIEKEKANPTLETVQNIARCMQADPITLLDESHAPYSVMNTISLLLMNCMDDGRTFSLDSLQRALDHVQLAVQILMGTDQTSSILQALQSEEMEELY